MTRRLRLAAAAVVMAAAVLTPTSSGADADGSAEGAVGATPQCAQGYTYDSVSGDCEKHETQPAHTSCPATIGGHAVEVSGSDCVTTTAHTTLPTYSCNTADGWALVGSPPECQRTVTRQVTTTRTVTDMVHYTQTYTVRVKSTVTEQVPYTVRKRVAPFTVRVRVPPLTKTYMAMETYTYTVRVRYCVTWDVVVGQSVCTKYGYRSEQRTGVRETLITEPAYHYENRPAYNYRTEQICCKPVTRTVYRDETRTRQVCCRPVTRTVTTTRTVRETQSAVPSASCTAAGYSLNSSSRCERPAGTRLGAVSHNCASGWTAVSGDSSTCERTLTQDPTWACAAGHSIDRATTPPHCHPDPADGGGTDPGGSDEQDAGGGGTGCSEVLDSVSAPLSGTWAAGCESSQKSTDQVPYWAYSYTLDLTCAVTVGVDVVSDLDPHVFVLDANSAVVGSDDDSGPDGRDSRIRGLSLAAGTYTIEVTTGTERTTGSFTLTVTGAGTCTGASQVTVSGLDPTTETPAAGDDSVAVADRITVTPVEATCTAAPAGATVTSATSPPGTVRWVTAEVRAGTTVRVTVTCSHGGASKKASALFTANAAPDPGECNDPLGTLGSASVSRSGMLGSESGCRSVRHHRYREGRVFYASRHTFRVAAAGWVTIDLVNAGSGAGRVDPYVILLNGASPDGTGIKLIHDDDSGAGFNSRIVRRFLQPGQYTIEATTFGIRDAGAYRLTVAADYRTKLTGRPGRLIGEVGKPIVGSWEYTPATTTRLAVASVTPDGLTASVYGDEGNASLTAVATRAGTYTVTVRYTNGPHTRTQPTTVTAVVVDRSCANSDGHRARQIHHHDPGHGHTDCQAHQPPECGTGYFNYWTPDGGSGHDQRNLKGCNHKNNSGIVDPELLLWSPYDIDAGGRPQLCQEAQTSNLQDLGDLLNKCLETHKLSVVTWRSGFDSDTWIAGYEAQTGRSVSDSVRSDLEMIHTAVENQETILVGTNDFSRATGNKDLDDAIVRLICGEVVELGVERGGDVAEKKVGAWARNRFPQSRVLGGLAKLNAMLSFAFTLFEVAYENLATNATCN